MKVAVFGAKGRMGGEACRAIEAECDLEVVAQIDLGDRRELALGADMAIDFTHPDAVVDNVAWCITNGLPVVVGTSGFTPERLDMLRELLGANPATGVLVVPNFSIGAVLMMHFSAGAAPYFESVEIIETHHTMKADAPSGTAAITARLVAASREAAGVGDMVDSTTHEAPGARGTEIAGVRVHSLRLPGLIAQQEVRLTSSGETLAIVNDARSRACYAPGIVAALRWIGDRKGLTVGLDTVLGLARS
ncbi:MAG: 4-hydroxy-tetrahydrodipicolinate reductase [Propionibacteriaceae bacterium]|jgi:4-hydroxy-tetrahydrodipicolinate reductase|nr:4-hydroxy-tetrahydrodipicolinate reductase [Propionibacteriaceae bacterium]